MGGDQGRGRSVALETFEVKILRDVKYQRIAFDASRRGLAKQCPSPGAEDLPRQLAAVTPAGAPHTIVEVRVRIR